MNKNPIWANEALASPSVTAGAARAQASVSRTDDVGTNQPQATWGPQARCQMTGLSPQATSAAPVRRAAGVLLTPRGTEASSRPTDAREMGGPYEGDRVDLRPRRPHGGLY